MPRAKAPAGVSSGAQASPRGRRAKPPSRGILVLGLNVLKSGAAISRLPAAAAAEFSLLLDYPTLLTAFALSACGLALTFHVSWLVSRTERFLIAWTLGVSFMGLGALGYVWYGQTMSPLIGAGGYTILLTGLAFVYGAGREFRTGTLPWRTMCVMVVVSASVMSVPMLTGHNGIAMVALNLAAMVIMLITAWDYWLGRAEARRTISLLTVLYAVTGLSFLPCAALLLLAGEWRLAQTPANWAEDLNIALCVATLAGIGALSLTLNQVRVARGHKRDAETDPLTGLLNRRALLDRIANQVGGPAALVILDMDHFKAINDVHGHMAGDEVLRGLGEVITTCCRAQDLPARLGGEEFAILLPDTTLAAAAALADGVRMRLAKRRFTGNGGAFTATLSAGVAHSDQSAIDFDTLLRDADNALYVAKHKGRDRISLGAGETTPSEQGPPSCPPAEIITLKAG